MNNVKNLPGPDALHVGFSKCASTFLQAYFEEHPSIFLVNQSHYFSPFAFSEFPAGKDGYCHLFDAAGPQQIKLESDEHIVMPLFHPVLEAAGTTLESVEEVTARIKSTAPAAKIIMVIRNQAGLIVSRYSEYILGGGTCTFDKFLSEFLECSTDGINYFQNFYCAIAEILESSFSSDNVIVLLQEELGANEDLTIQQLSDFLGVDFRKPSRHGMVSRRLGLSLWGLRFLRAFNKLVVKRQKRSFKEAEVKIPFLMYKIIQRGFRVIDYYLPRAIKGDKNAILTQSAKQRIHSVFSEDNARLAAKLSKDLAKFGY